MYNMSEYFDISNATALAGIVSILSEMAKALLPKKIPTKPVVLVISIIVTIIYFLSLGDINLIKFLYAIIDGFVVAYISTFGYDTLKDITKRVIPKDSDLNDE